MGLRSCHSRCCPQWCLATAAAGLLGLLLFWQLPADLGEGASETQGPTPRCPEFGPGPGPPESFTELLQRSGSDKWWDHHYERYYERWLAPYRSAAGMKVLEIGARKGHSLNLWAEYFRAPELICGLAYGRSGDLEELVNQTGVRVVHGDQSSSKVMQQLVLMGPWDIIIDDGSHVPRHVIFSLFALWSSVKPGGLYVVEDLETSYWRSGRHVYGYLLEGTGVGAGAGHSAATKLEQISQVLIGQNLSVMPGDGSLCSVEWGMNLVVLRKCAESAERDPSAAARGPAAAPGLRKWLQQAAASNPPALPLARGKAPANSAPSCGAAPPNTSLATALGQLGPEGLSWSRQLYARDHESWLAPFRSSPVKVVELTSQPNLSVRLWAQYFQNASAVLGVYQAAPGAGHGQRPVPGTPGASAYAADVGTEQAMRAVSKQGPWDIIVDDGARGASDRDRLFCLFALWRAVAPGGVYVIENVTRTSWRSIPPATASTSMTNTGVVPPGEVSLDAKLHQVRGWIFFQGLQVQLAVGFCTSDGETGVFQLRGARRRHLVDTDAAAPLEEAAQDQTAREAESEVEAKADMGDDVEAPPVDHKVVRGLSTDGVTDCRV